MNINIYKIIAPVGLVWFGLWLYGLQYNVFINTKAKELFDEKYCWLIRDKSSNFGLVDIIYDKNIDAPIFSNSWNYFFPYWRIGSQPIYFGLVHIDTEHYKSNIYGWSYRKKEFWSTERVFIPLRRQLIKTCKKTLLNRAKLEKD